MSNTTIADQKPTQQLSEAHRKYLDDRAISGDVAAERGYRSIVAKAELGRLGFSENQRRAGLLLPLWGVFGEIIGYQLRAELPPLIADPTIPLLITEGIPKADAAVSIGLCCVALLGVWGWRGANEVGGKVALAAWESVALNDRPSYIVFDSDVMTKRGPSAALSCLGPFLESRGAVVRYIYLPPGENGAKLGLDDYIADRKRGFTVRRIKVVK
jgi:hypothetical protein